MVPHVCRSQTVPLWKILQHILNITCDHSLQYTQVTNFTASLAHDDHTAPYRTSTSSGAATVYNY